MKWKIVSECFWTWVNWWKSPLTLWHHQNWHHNFFFSCWSCCVTLIFDWPPCVSFLGSFLAVRVIETVCNGYSAAISYLNYVLKGSAFNLDLQFSEMRMKYPQILSNTRSYSSNLLNKAAHRLTIVTALDQKISIHKYQQVNLKCTQYRELSINESVKEHSV